MNKKRHIITHSFEHIEHSLGGDSNVSSFRKCKGFSTVSSSTVSWHEAFILGCVKNGNNRQAVSIMSTQAVERSKCRVAFENFTSCRLISFRSSLV